MVGERREYTVRCTPTFDIDPIWFVVSAPEEVNDKFFSAYTRTINMLEQTKIDCRTASFCDSYVIMPPELRSLETVVVSRAEHIRDDVGVATEYYNEEVYDFVHALVDNEDMIRLHEYRDGVLYYTLTDDIEDEMGEYVMQVCERVKFPYKLKHFVLE